MYQTILSPFNMDEHQPGLEALYSEGWLLNKPELPKGERLARIAAVQRGICEMTRSVLQQGKMPVCIGGDCFSVMGISAALQQQQVFPVLLQLDAHGDLNTPETSPSGYLGGMTLAMIMGYGPQDCTQALQIRPYSPADVVLAGARDLDQGEAVLINKLHLSWIKDIEELATFDFEDRPVYIHLDADVLNPLDAPAMEFPAAGGPRAERLKAVLAHIRQTRQLCAVSMNTWAPALDPDGRSRRACMDVLSALLD